MDEIAHHLKRLRRKMTAQLFIERLTWCVLAFAGVGLLGMFVNHLRHVALWDARFQWIAATVAFFTALIWTWSQRPSLEQTANRIDRLGQTRDRFLTAFSFSKSESGTPMQTCALEECRRFIRSFDCGPFIRLRVPAQAMYLLVPLVAAGLLTWHSRIARDEHQPDAAAQKELAEKARELEKLAKQIEKKNEELKSDDLKKIAGQLKQSAGHLQSQKTDDAGKSALRELSSLEAMIRQMQKSAPSPNELAALAEALKNNSSTKDAATALEAGKLAEAAKRLEELSRQPRDKTADEQLAQAMREAMSRLSASQQSELTQQMAKLAQSAESGRQAGEALQRLAQMLQQMAQQPGSASEAKSQALQNALYALQNMKYGQPNEKTGDGKKEGDGKIVIQSFSSPGAKGRPLAGDPSIPSGKPGSERDEGTTKTPYGEKQQRGPEDGTASQLSGTLGEGESLHDMVSTTGDTSKSTRRYRDLYNAMAPAAEDAILQENIPLGSRFFVKRYFENIRPKE